MNTVPVVELKVAGETACPGLGRPYTVVFDGTCAVCTRLSGLLIKWDREQQLEVVASQTPGVKARFPWIPDRAYAAALQMVGPGDETWQGAAAVEQLLRVLPKGRLFSWLFKIPHVRRIVDRLYRWFARNRYNFGCGQHCMARPEDEVLRVR